MAEMTLDQQKAIALASARARAADAQQASQQPQSIGDQIGSYANGIYAGLHSLPQSVAEIGARGLDATGLTDNSYKNLHGAFQDMNSIAANGQTDNQFYKGGQIGGQVLSSLPAMELKAPAAIASRLPTLAKIATGAAQGAGAGALTSNTSDAPLGEQVGLGAAGGAALPVLGAGMRLAGKAIPMVLGQTTGAGAESVRNAFQAGAAGGDQGAAFLSNMRDPSKWGQVVIDAKQALGNMRVERGAAYRSGMTDISKDKSILSFDPIDAAMDKADSVKSFKGVDLSPKTADVRKELDDTISHWSGLDPAEYHTPEGFDALKQKIGDIKDAQPFGSPQRTIASDAYNAVRKTIADQAPTYDRVMRGYSQASDHLEAIQKELSLGPKGNPNTALRKLQSIMRDNANTSWGNRAQNAQTLTDAGAPNLLPSLAGQALSTAIPRGLAKYGDLALALGGGLTNPGTLATLPLASPRFVGEAAYGLGAAGRGINSGATALFGSTAPRTVLDQLRLLSAPTLGATLPQLVGQGR